MTTSRTRSDSPASMAYPFDLQIADTDFVVCDVETTGLSAERCRLTEIALVRIREGRITDRYESLINPRQFITREITELTGITNEMVYHAPPAEEVIPIARRFIGDAVFVAHNVRFDRSFVDTALHRAGIEPLAVPNLCTARLARRLTPQLSRKSLGAIARHLGIRIRNRHRAAGDAEATASILLHFLHVLEEEFELHELSELLSFQNRPVYRITGPPKNVLRLRPVLETVPHAPGIYFFHGKSGDIIYIGKARDLRERVGSYFSHNVGHTDKVRRLAQSVHAIAWKTTETELSALLAEARAVRQHQPRFNTMLKNTRKYPFITIDRGDAFPRVAWSYEMDDPEAEYYGPFSSRTAVERALESIDRLFLIRECDGPIKPDTRTAPCLYYDIKRCGAPCAAIQSREEYLEEVRGVELFLLGRFDAVLDGLRAVMDRKAEALDFESAAILRDRIADLERITRQQRAMARSIRRQQLVIVTPARRSLVEVHLIKGGMLARQLLVDQKAIPRAELRSALEEVFHGRQEELFEGGIEDINEMRIIASWCLTRREESQVIEADAFPTLSGLTAETVRVVRAAGIPAEQRRASGAAMA